MVKTFRVLSMYDRMMAGKVLVKRFEAERFGVDERSIQRDLEDIRTHLADERRDDVELVYDRRRMGYVMRKKRK